MHEQMMITYARRCALRPPCAHYTYTAYCVPLACIMPLLKVMPAAALSANGTCACGGNEIELLRRASRSTLQRGAACYGMRYAGMRTTREAMWRAAWRLGPRRRARVRDCLKILRGSFGSSVVTLCVRTDHSSSRTGPAYSCKKSASVYPYR